MASSSKLEPVAIIGIGGIFPCAKSVNEYWRNIIDKVDCLEQVPASRWKTEDYYDPDPSAADKVYSCLGGFIPEVAFDPVEFGLPPQSLKVIDSAQLLSLLVARDTLEDAGYSYRSDYDHARTGVVLGVAGTTMKLIQPLSTRMEYPVLENILAMTGLDDAHIRGISQAFRNRYVGWNENAFPGFLGNIVAGRISNRLGLGGLNCTVDAACASSLCAVNMAIGVLATRQCDLVLTGGVDTDNSITAYMSFAKTGVLSRSGKIRPFDRRADGTLIAEGIGMLALKRLDDALRDEDRVYAVIRGIGTASDGRCKSIYAPHLSGQVRAIEAAFAAAGVSAAGVGLVEAHAPGTPTGDATELAALQAVFTAAGAPAQVTALGSVKSQIGHTKAAAGAAGLIKVALALHHKILPPTLNFEEANPELKLGESAFYLNTDTRPWLSSVDQPRRACVNALGFGGTNYHAVLEEAPVQAKTPPKRILFTSALPAKTLSLEGAVAVFPGQGAQYVSMGKELALVYPDYARIIGELDQRLVARGYAPLSSVLFPPPVQTAEAKAQQELRLRQTLYAQASIAAFSMACYRVLQTQGFRPQFALGHSFGELTALWAAEVLSDSDYLDLVCARGEVLTPPEHSAASGMLSVAAGIAALEAVLAECPGVSIANVNAPDQTVIGGPEAALRHAETRLRSAGFTVVALNVAAAFHTEAVYFAREPWQVALARVTFHPPRISVYANTTSLPYPHEADAIRAQLAEHPFRSVLFQPSVEQLYAAGGRTFVEIGPRNILSRLIEASLRGKPCQILAVNPQKSDGLAQLNSALATLGLAVPKAADDEPVTKKSSAELQISAAQIISNEDQQAYANSIEVLRRQPLTTPTAPLPTAPSDGVWQEAVRCHHAMQTATLEAHQQFLMAQAEHTRLIAQSVNASADMREVLQAANETLASLGRLHQQYLNDQMTSTQAFLALLQQTPAATLPAPVAVSQPLLETPVLPPVVAILEPVPSAPANAATLNTTILNIIAEKTGYPAEVIEPGMDLEADLGIDSIKRVEILAALREQIGLEADLNAAAEIRTIGDIEQQIRQQLPTQAGPLTKPLDVVARQTPAPSPLQTNTDVLQAAILNVIAEKTGYPPEVIEPNMDLEADLGIDSIKRVEILAALRERIGLEADLAAAAEIRTIGDIEQQIRQQMSVLVAEPVLPTTIDVSAIHAAILAVIAEKTGYPQEVIEPGMDLEADLGIDSIKRVEILAALRERINLGADLVAAAEIRTIADIVVQVQQAVDGSVVKPSYAAQAESIPAPQAWTIPLTQPVLQALLPIATMPLAFPREHRLLVLSDGGPVAQQLAAVLTAHAIPVLLLLDPSAETNSNAKLADWSEASLRTALAEGLPIAGAIRLWERAELSLSEQRAGLKHSIALAKVLEPALRQASSLGRAGLLFAYRLDGQLGRVAAGAHPWLAGLPGLVKTLRHEWPNIALRAVDLGPDPNAVELTASPFGKGGSRGISSSSCERSVPKIPPNPPFAKGGTENFVFNSTALDTDRHESDARRLFAEFFDIASEPLEVGYSPAGRVGLSHQVVEVPTTPAQPCPDAPLNLLVTGGGRGITAVCAAAYARRQPCRVLLLGRTALTELGADWVIAADAAGLKARISRFLTESGEQPSPKAIERLYRQITASQDIRETLQTLQAQGVEARYLAVDISDAAALQQTLAPVIAEWGAFTGLIHGAGALADKRVVDLSERDFETVFAPKVDGLKNLLNLLDVSQLRLCALFSSSASVFGNPGQAVYAMANEILNKLALQLRHDYPNSRATAFCWGPWDAGMVTPELRRLFSERGIRAIPPQAGGELFTAFVAQDDLPAQIVISDAMTAAAPPVQELRFARHFRVADFPFVQDHQIDGHPVLPAAWLLSWMAQAGEAAFPGLHFVEARQFRVLKGIVFDASLAERHELVLSNLERDDAQARCAATITSLDSAGRRRSHYAAELLFSVAAPPAPSIEPPPTASVLADVAGFSYRQGLIQFGPSFHGLDDVLELSAERIITRLQLPPPSLATTGAFPVDAFAPHSYDLATHGVLIWLEHFHHNACLPAETRRFVQYQAIAPETPCYVTLDIQAFQPPWVEFSFTTHDGAGRVFNRGEGLRMILANRSEAAHG